MHLRSPRIEWPSTKDLSAGSTVASVLSDCIIDPCSSAWHYLISRQRKQRKKINDFIGIDRKDISQEDESTSHAT